ncbi:enolase C-terminal domain-like protein [Anaeromyxobacter sp. Fw109-5]|uniref:enolase C-terminal domain-like protein n=1 Tax=Anaeromyxobacter sp. (strain Fw109-5) TaxID=404589 RepID=UPI001F3BD4F7|nr:enolase C-terminal domain-like protein [Anaeromyxobacter sp. Fw109-5]
MELLTEEGVTGRGYLAPYLPRSLKYLAPMVRDLGARLAGGPGGAGAERRRRATLVHALAAQACDLVMPDLMRIGGVTGWLRAAALAAAWGIDLSSHLYPEISSHLMRVTPTAHWIEWQDWAHPVLGQPFLVKDGFIHPREVPGNGLAWDGDAVRRYAVEC